MMLFRIGQHLAIWAAVWSRNETGGVCGVCGGESPMRAESKAVWCQACQAWRAAR